MENITIQEKIFIIQPETDAEDVAPLLAEAVSLVESAGALHAGSICVKIREINPATFLGEGKLALLKERLDGLDVTVLFNGDLSPSQTINMSASLGDKKIIDRTTLILAIFAKNAKSNEGKLQVELAQLKYIYPRLKGKGEALSRLGGGIGTRGPGETKLETDRRRIRARITFLEEKLRGLENRRNLIRTRRKKISAYTVSLIGYTNTGKSTLLNRLTESDVYAADRLFATLDTTSRRLLIDGSEFILTDTVGFLRDLPHDLISAFRSTLESALDCDLALIVCDATADYEMQLKTALDTLQEMNCHAPYIIVMNKSENLDSHIGFPQNSIFISEKQGMEINALKDAILSRFREKFTETALYIPYTELGQYNRLRRFLIEKNTEYTDSGITASVRIPTVHLKKFAPYFIHD